jgi:hypothetical protein
MTQLFTTPNFREALVRTSLNIVKLGAFAAASIFATTVFKTQASCTIQNAQSDYFTIRDLAKGI